MCTFCDKHRDKNHWNEPNPPETTLWYPRSPKMRMGNGSLPGICLMHSPKIRNITIHILSLYHREMFKKYLSELNGPLKVSYLLPRRNSPKFDFEFESGADFYKCIWDEKPHSDFWLSLFEMSPFKVGRISFSKKKWSGIDF